MRTRIITLAVTWAAGATALALALAAGAGCSNHDSPPPEPRSRVKTERPVRVPIREAEEEKPLPGREPVSDMPPPPFYDVPLVNQRPPEQRAFVDAYEAVGRPRILVFVNRTLEGEIIPVNGTDPRTMAGGAAAGGSVADRDAAGRDTRRRDAYLHPGQYDEVDARSLDYEAMENILIDWLAADGRVEIVSPVMARQRLTDEQVRELQQGRPRVMGEIAKQLDADVLVQVQAHPTRQTTRGLEVRVIAEAINVSRGGQSVARAVVDVMPPLDKPQVNKYTRFLARKLMDGMIGTWQAMANRPDRPGDQPGDRPARDDRIEQREAPPGRDERRPLPQRGSSSRDLIDDRPASAPAGTRPAPTTRPSAPPADEKPVGASPGVPPAGERSGGDR